MNELISATRLTVSLPGAGEVLSDVSLHVARGEILAIVGESGAGKSVLARTLLGLTQDVPGARVSATSLTVADVDLIRAGRRDRRAMRGRDVALVLQDALQSLDPLRTVEAEVGEALAVRRVSRAERRWRVVEALTDAGLPVSDLPGADNVLRRRSGELSGGMRQRALIASAVIGGAPVIIADEPTTALDATTAVHVLDLLGRLRDAGTGLILISHDLHAVARIADRIAVLDGGRVVDTGPTQELLSAPSHPTTRALIDAIVADPKPAAASGAETASTPPLLSAAAVSKAYRSTTAVDEVSVELRAGETLGVVGESGSGKSTLARLLIGAESPDSGTVSSADPAPRVRLVPQDPLGSFDPRHTVERILRHSRRDGAASPADLLERVGLAPALLARRPASLSGGQRQRVAIARALAAQPNVLVCDEPVSALDVTTQAGILDLLLALQRDEGLGMLFISHDLAVVRRVSDRVAVMRAGRIVETGPTEQVYATPRDPFTRELIAASR